jgi:hypothetical protein
MSEITLKNLLKEITTKSQEWYSSTQQMQQLVYKLLLIIIPQWLGHQLTKELHLQAWFVQSMIALFGLEALLLSSVYDVFEFAEACCIMRSKGRKSRLTLAELIPLVRLLSKNNTTNPDSEECCLCCIVCSMIWCIQTHIQNVIVSSTGA